MKSFFSSFAMPYMNGPLHLGHFYTLLNSWIASRYQQMIGDRDIFIPFSFHCTGMPIYSNAMKLLACPDDKGVTEILRISGIDDTVNFSDPDHWVTYFSDRTYDDLSRLSLQDTTLKNSFITTDRNPYYNKFVEWQFIRLKTHNMISFQDRPCIYSIHDKQPCADHDRQSGEGVVPVKCKLSYNNGTFIILTPDDQKIYKDKGDNILVNINGQSGYISEYVYLCIQHQYDKLDHVSDVYLPSSKVVSRSGDTCIVATTGQWYLNYSDPTWKQLVMHYIKNMLVVHDDAVMKQLLISAENMHDWCISREYGLGTPIPWDSKFKIDSLSDSTVYWVYYAVADLLQGDIYGETQGTLGLSPDQLVPEFWDYIFEISCDPPTGIHEDALDKCRNRIAKYLPLDVHVSGKDLINNHLVMAIYNGVYFGKKFLPKEYLVNGHVKVNDNKMSKSSGNFITMSDALDKYPRDSLIMALVEAGDGFNDANIRLKDIPKVTQVLKRTLHVLESPDPSGASSASDRDSLDYMVYRSGLTECYNTMIRAYETGRYREAVTYGWRKALKFYDRFSNHGFVELNILCKNIMRTALHPILNISSPLLPLKVYEYDSNVMKLDELIGILKTLLDRKGKEKIYKIGLHSKIFDNDYNHGIVKAFLDAHDIILVINDEPIHAKRDPFKVKPQIINH